MAVTGIGKDIHNLMRNIASFSDGQATIRDFDCESDVELTVRIVPNDGLYRGGTFDFSINFSSYPENAPAVTCLTKIYHPNIEIGDSDDGSICLNLLDSDWTSTCTLEDVVQGILFLLYNPNLEDPLSSWFDSSDIDTEEFAENVARSLRGESVDDIEFERNCCLEVEPTVSIEETVAAVMEDILTSLMDIAKISTENSCDVSEIIPVKREITDKTETVLPEEDNMVLGDTTLTNTPLTDTTDLSTFDGVENNSIIKHDRETTPEKTFISTVPESATIGDVTPVDVNSNLQEKTSFVCRPRRQESLLYSDNLAPEISLMCAFVPKVLKYVFNFLCLRSKKSDGFS